MGGGSIGMGGGSTGMGAGSKGMGGRGISSSRRMYIKTNIYGAAGTGSSPFASRSTQRSPDVARPPTAPIKRIIMKKNFLLFVISLFVLRKIRFYCLFLLLVCNLWH
ncbi:hypothetical protein QJS10_CPB11g01765 [Acorus calamus]|uniref:Uncharacterized protein n=1 Tax=Acorus calamus TaxID=4465 RepID=A0AAV9DTM6_ACOCL|nr:hypothetical protein QJS10_CPB11g01765 [Acorus calamus]